MSEKSRDIPIEKLVKISYEALSISGSLNLSMGHVHFTFT